MVTVTSVSALRERIRAWRGAGDTIGLVPTMGALHAGHISLVHRSRSLATRTCASIFVNPKQFAPGEDFARYPRSPEADAALLHTEGVDLLFTPDVAEIYAPDHATHVRVDGLGDTLDGTFRPGHFDGVATVVAKLLLQALPDVAVFGEKDWQQLQVIRRMVRDLNVPVRIEGAPTMREPDGLALSSRNAYLTPQERTAAPALFRALTAVAAAVAGGEAAIPECDRAIRALEQAGFGAVDYLTVRDAVTLDARTDPSRPRRVLAAARLGRARLIDNVPVP
ncbi:MAG: pantoate--beta-alanine ligase [Longimicrobiales bacterium]